MSEYVFGDLPAINQYLSTSADAKLFLHGTDKTGNTTLIKAAAEKSHEMVFLLLQNGADVGAVNNDGRSALMEAALWGRMESVRAFLNANADKRLQDHQGHCAMDLAQPTRKNQQEGYRRSPFAAAESLPERDRDRRQIVIILGGSNVDKHHEYTEPLSKIARNKYGFRKSQSEMTITLYGPIQNYHVPRITKCAAVLDRGDQFARISATSGWGTDTLPPNDKTGPQWIEKVYYIASAVGHTFQDAPDPTWDHGKPGQHFASHAEKKLIAYFLDKHIFMPQDNELNRILENLILDVNDSLDDGKRSSTVWANVRDLEERKAKLDLQLFDADDRLLGDAYDEQDVKRLQHEIRAIDEELSSLESDADVARIRAQEQKKYMLLERRKVHQDLVELGRHAPPISLKRAVILSSNKICEDCAIFSKRVNDCFQLNIELTWCI